jgi:hypothetical protein
VIRKRGFLGSEDIDHAVEELLAEAKNG